MLSMVFEVIQPDLEINRRHTTTLLIPLRGSSVRAASGSSVEGFGQILAVALRRWEDWAVQPGHAGSLGIAGRAQAEGETGGVKSFTQMKIREIRMRHCGTHVRDVAPMR